MYVYQAEPSLCGRRRPPKEHEQERPHLIYLSATHTHTHHINNPADYVPAGPDQLPPAYQQDGVGQGPGAEGHRVRFFLFKCWMSVVMVVVVVYV